MVGPFGSRFPGCAGPRLRIKRSFYSVRMLPDSSYLIRVYIVTQSLLLNLPEDLHRASSRVFPGEVNREIEVPQIEYIDSWSRSVGLRE